MHVARDVHEAKFWLEPVRMVWSRGFSGNERRRIEAIVTEHVQELSA